MLASSQQQQSAPTQAPASRPGVSSSASNPGPWRALLFRREFRLLAIFTAVLVLCFGWPLFSLARFSIQHDLYSHILLIPFISLYLAWLKKDSLFPQGPSLNPSSAASPGAGAAGGDPPDRKLAVLPLVFGGALLLGWLFRLIGSIRGFYPAALPAEDSLAWITLSFYLLFLGACALALGRQTLRALAFPLGFLVFIVPFPGLLTRAFESFLQYRSADAAALFFSLIGTPYVRSDVIFQLPGFSLAVAPECSGIRSTLVLFISSLVAGQLFLRSPWKRALFALVVIPLGIFRNAFRIATIAELCVHVNPGFIDSPLHRRGGPLFFALSMIPFLLLLYYLRKTDAAKHPS